MTGPQSESDYDTYFQFIVGKSKGFIWKGVFNQMIIYFIVGNSSIPICTT